MSQVFSDAIFSQMNEPSNISNHLLKQPRSRLPDKGEFFKIRPDLGPRDEFSQKKVRLVMIEECPKWATLVLKQQNQNFQMATASPFLVRF